MNDVTKTLLIILGAGVFYGTVMHCYDDSQDARIRHVTDTPNTPLSLIHI